MLKDSITLKEVVYLAGIYNSINKLSPISMGSLGIPSEVVDERDILENLQSLNNTDSKTSETVLLEQVLSLYLKTKQDISNATKNELEVLNDVKRKTFKILMKLLPERF